MKQKHTLWIFLFCIGWCISPVIAQSWTEEVVLNWKGICKENLTVSECTYMYFNQAELQRHSSQLIPIWKKTYEGMGPCRVTVQVSQMVWERLTDEEISSLPLDYVDSAGGKAAVSDLVTRRQAVTEVRICPFRKVDGHYEKLMSFHLQGQWQPLSLSLSSNRNYVSQSVLSDGEIYKVSLVKTGVYKLTYNVLNTLGVSMKQLDIHSVSIYGNGGNMLPENTHEAVFDDPQEVPVKVVDIDGDGIFDAEDYILFYAIGTTKWKVSSKSFVHELNFYSDKAYYFVKIGTPPSRTVRSLGSDSLVPTHSTSAYNYYSCLEEDLISATGKGRIWFKDLFDATTSRTYAFSIPEPVENEPVRMCLRMGVSSLSYASYFSYRATGGALSSANFPAGKGMLREGIYTFVPSSTNFTLELNYSKPSNSSKGWLDFIELNALCKLQQSAPQMSFRYLASCGSGNVTEYHLDTKGHEVCVWDVTNPWDCREIRGNLRGDLLVFRSSSDSLREYVSFYGNTLYEVSPAGRVVNQNLHEEGSCDLVIVTHPSFLSTANQLADFRKENDGLQVKVVTTTQVYNEFGSGMQDIAAIRNYLKMLYDRYGEQAPKNVLLMGKTSYDFRNIKGQSSNFIPNYQGSDIFDEDVCLSSDDFFVKLDDYEGNNNTGTLDMGLGRLPFSTAAQARAVLQKLKNYASAESLNQASSNEVSNHADWRNIVAFCADDDADEQLHLYNADHIAQMVSQEYPVYNLDKIYLDAYKKVSTSQGQRYPDATTAINQRVNNGCLMFCYMGHGGDNGWTHERVLKRSDISGWKNRYNLPFFYAGSCSFGEYDKLDATSPSEDMLFKSDGGAVGIVAASRSSYGSANETFGIYFHKFALSEDSAGNHMTMGEAFSRAKNLCGSVQMYIFFGDPSMKLAYPTYQVMTDSINGISMDVFNDTLHALSYVTISGHVSREDGQMADGFSGYVYPTVYDKASTVTTLLNNANSEEKQFQLQKNTLFKGKVPVTDGHFQFRFLLPKDINYDDGYGKISYYAFGNGMDAKGYDTVCVGGISDTLISDDRGPEIRLYLNGESFVNGGITSPNPILIADLKDENGINAAGTGIGHDIVAILDGDETNRMILNDYYECEENSSTSGKIHYLLHDLPLGEHTLVLRAWDVLNNRGEGSLQFTVTDNQHIRLENLLNYPNPFTTHTRFYFEHNQSNTTMKVVIQIFTVSGRLVKTLTRDEYTGSFRFGPIEWDGTDDSGGRLAQGVYVYRLKVRTSDGKEAEKIEKLVIL